MKLSLIPLAVLAILFIAIEINAYYSRSGSKVGNARGRQQRNRNNKGRGHQRRGRGSGSRSRSGNGSSSSSSSGSRQSRFMNHGGDWSYDKMVAQYAQKLELSRAEKYVHNFVIDVELDKTLKESAAKILCYAWRTYRGRKRGETESQIRTYQRKLLRAITDIRKCKQEQRKMVDSQVTVLEVFKNQAFITDSVENIINRQESLESTVESVRNQVHHIGGKLDELCRIMAARRDRRESRREPGYLQGAEGGDY